MRLAVAILLALALGLASAFLVACGDRNNLIPSTDASAINDRLDAAASAVAAHRCDAAQSAVIEAERRASALPGSVDPKLRRTLQDNLEHVASRASDQCTQSTASTTTTSTTTAPTTATEPTTTETQPTTTETQPTTTQEPPPTTETTDTGNSGGVAPGGKDKGRGPSD